MKSREFGQETEGKLRQFYRILISYNDFKQAGQIASYILEHNLHDRVRESRILLEALNCAMIVAYCRPFSGSDRKTRPKTPDLPGRFFRLLTDSERKLHEVVMADRNTVLAHSDSSAWNLRPKVFEIQGQRILVPVSSDTRAPLTLEATAKLQQMCDKLMEEVYSERMQLEAELLDCFEKIAFTDEELEAFTKDVLGEKK